MASGVRLLGFRCTRCGNCCRDVRVPLTDSDLVRLVASTGKQEHDLVDWLSAEDADITGEPAVLLDRGFRLMALRHEHGGCVLLDEKTECSAYDARPMPCRTYPLVASFGRRGGVRRLRLLEGSQCDFARDGRVDAHALRVSTQRQEDELTRYTHATQRWNQLQKRRARFRHELGDAADFVAWILDQRERASA